MAHESFEDPEVGRVLNDGFVSIKVDREERPDMTPMVPELSREIERMRREADLSTEEVLESLRRERERYHREGHAD